MDGKMEHEVDISERIYWHCNRLVFLRINNLWMEKWNMKLI